MLSVMWQELDWLRFLIQRLRDRGVVTFEDEQWAEAMRQIRVFERRVARGEQLSADERRSWVRLRRVLPEI